MRDPFVFNCSATGGQRMLLAEPCDWTTWQTDPPSQLSVWLKAETGWIQVGTIGPWSPRGIMWEVPVLLDFGDKQALIVSLVDRRDGLSVCSVRYWIGKFDGCQFTTDTPLEGRLLDHGPDFYATSVNTQAGWPDGDRIILGWASSWATARTMAWSGNVAGGPISLPRSLSLADGRLQQRPIEAALSFATAVTWAPGERLDLCFEGADASFQISISAKGQFKAARSGSEPTIVWSRVVVSFLACPTNVQIFNDCGLIEIFFKTEGKTLTVFVPGATTAERYTI